jgi:hypothetical protein
MSQNRIVSEHMGSGIWRFTCYAHDKPFVDQGVSSPKDAITTMLDHCDDCHEGETILVRRMSSPSASNYAHNYTAKVRK